MIGSKQLSFKFKELYHGKERTGFSVVPTLHSNMYRIQWPDGVLSEDMYNLTRARDHAARLYAEGENKALGSPADAFK
jgi:hypothetical protein